jgi:hypothetical protein
MEGEAPAGKDDGSVGRDQVPSSLRHDESDAPVPTWEQVTKSTERRDDHRTLAVTRLLGGTEEEARDRFERLEPRERRSFALLVDKIDNEGWLDQVGRVSALWDDTMFFDVRDASDGVTPLAERLAGASNYTQNTAWNGLAAYFNAWNHPDWTDAYMENDAGHGALHVGIFEDGTGEVHFEVYNALFTNGAPSGQVVWGPGVGWLNAWHFARHQWWEGARFGPVTRRSANFYFLLRDGGVPMSF